MNETHAAAVKPQILQDKNVLMVGSVSVTEPISRFLGREGAKVHNTTTTVSIGGLGANKADEINAELDAMKSRSELPDVVVIHTPGLSGKPEDNPALKLAARITGEKIPVIILGIGGDSSAAKSFMKKHRIAYLEADKGIKLIAGAIANTLRSTLAHVG